MDRKPHSLHLSSSVLRTIAIGLLVVSPVVGQRVYPSGQTNSNSGKRSHNATIRSADSSDGSRVSITADQSLTDYEAYRRGERFYVKIPAAEVPRAEAVRGRGFNDVTAQRSGDGTTLSFRLQPGASAHVEQRGNKLDVVISAAGGGSSTTAANRPRDFRWSDASASAGSRGTNSRVAAPERSNDAAGNNANKRSNQSTAANKNASSVRDNASPANSNSRSKPGNANSSAGDNKTGNANPAAANTTSNSNANSASNAAGNTNSSTGLTTNNAASAVSPSNSPSGLTTSSSPGASAQASATPANSASPAAASQTAARSDFWTRAKERGHYWLLLAQLNPVPVAIGAAILVLLIALLFMQRRRAKATRRVRAVTTSPSPRVETAVPTPVAPVEPAVAAAVVAAAPMTTSEDVSETRVAAVAPAGSENGKRERTSRAAEEANKIFAGEAYDQSLIGSNNPETRRLVGAELLSAMVGRNIERRDRARAAFMKHGYFDDATRDLRVGSSDNERAAAARRLSFAQDPEATPHLVGALNDSSPDVRRAAVEALMDQRDPAAIAPLNALMQNETDRKVPRHLIEKAIEACATNTAQSSIPTPAVHSARPPAIETDREVIEI